MGVSFENEVLKKQKRKAKEQKQAVLDNAEIGIANDEACLDLTDLVMAQAEEIAALRDEIIKIKGDNA